MIARGMTNPEIAERALPQQPHRQEPHQPDLRQDRSRDRAAATQYAQAHNLQ